MRFEKLRVFFVLILLSTSFYSFQFFAIGTYGVKLSDILLIAFYGWLAWRVATRGITLSPLLHPITLLLFFPLLAVAFSVVTPIVSLGQGTQFLKTFSHFLFYYGFFLCVVLLDPRASFATFFIRIFLIWGFLVSLYGVYQLPARVFDLPLGWLPVTNVSVFASRTPDPYKLTKTASQLSLQYSQFFRSTSLFSEPSVLGRMAATMLLFVLVPYIQKEKPFLPKGWSIAIGITLVLAIFASLSLTGVGGVIVLLVSIVLLEGLRRSRVLFGYLVAMVLVIVIAAKILTPIVQIDILDLYFQRISRILKIGTTPFTEHISGESTSTRLKGMQVSLEVWEEYPVVGIGAGHFYLSETAQREGFVFSSTMYTALLSETGVVGFTLFMAFLLGLFFAALQLYYHRKQWQDAELRRLAGVLPYLVILYLFFKLSSTVYVSLWVDLIFAFRMVMELVGRTGSVLSAPLLLRIPSLKTVFSSR